MCLEYDVKIILEDYLLFYKMEFFWVVIFIIVYWRVILNRIIRIFGLFIFVLFELK